jgi:anthranilate phosphoribosyltransferase
LVTAAERWPDVLTALLAGRSLDVEQASWAMESVMSGSATPAQIAGFVIGLRAKGETAHEVAALASVMLGFAAPLDLAPGLRAVDTCGTGGDRSNTVNISTMAAIVAAGAGAQVVKHGGRSATSLCGSADLLEALGVVIDLPPAGVAACIAQGAPAFCFAPVFHPAMRHAAPTRRELAVPTVFNILGPLTNPARPASQVVGVPDARLASVMAEVFATRSVDAMVVRGDDGLDELTTATTSRVWWVRQGGVEVETVDPFSLGLQAGDLTGGDPAYNADACRRVLAGERGAVRDAVLLNAAAGLAVYQPAPGSLHDQLAAGLVRAAISIDSGAAASALDEWVRASVAAR